MTHTLTAIELGSDSCVVARVHPRALAARVSAVHGLHDEETFPDVGRGEYLRRVRRRKKFPKHARVVAWGIPESASPADPAAAALLAPVLQAGFIVDAVVSPPEALALLARQLPRAPGGGAAAWLALNRRAAAIAIVDGGELRFSRAFEWKYRPGATQKDELLQRYSLIAHLAPELRHGFDVVRAQHGATVDTVITCGDLPDLRSLTMPLIEELDMEVETLDSLEGLEIAAPLTAAEVLDKAPAVRLACAAAAGVTIREQRAPSGAWIAAAAVAVLAVGIWAAEWMGDRGVSEQAAPPETRRSRPATPPSHQPVEAPRPTASIPRDDRSTAEPKADPRPTAVPDGRPSPADADVPAATTGLRGSADPDAIGRVPPLASQRPGAAESGGPAGRPEPAAPAASSPRAAVLPQQRRAAPLDAPLPAVNSIMVAPDRRLAVADGVIVREGDAVGPRVLIRIEPDALVLREPSGHEVRVPIRRKLTGK